MPVLSWVTEVPVLSLEAYSRTYCVQKDTKLVPQNTAASAVVLSIAVRGSRVIGPLFLIAHAPLLVKARRPQIHVEVSTRSSEPYI